jgi:hypothetical protein
MATIEPAFFAFRNFLADISMDVCNMLIIIVSDTFQAFPYI